MLTEKLNHDGPKQNARRTEQVTFQAFDLNPKAGPKMQGNRTAAKDRGISSLGGTSRNQNASALNSGEDIHLLVDEQHNAFEHHHAAPEKKAGGVQQRQVASKHQPVRR